MRNGFILSYSCVLQLHSRIITCFLQVIIISLQIASLIKIIKLHFASLFKIR